MGLCCCQTIEQQLNERSRHLQCHQISQLSENGAWSEHWLNTINTNLEEDLGSAGTLLGTFDNRDLSFSVIQSDSYYWKISLFFVRGYFSRSTSLEINLCFSKGSVFRLYLLLERFRKNREKFCKHRNAELFRYNFGADWRKRLNAC